MAVKARFVGWLPTLMSLSALLFINSVLQFIATPGNRWVAYFTKSQPYQLEALDQSWSTFAKNIFNQYQLLQKTINLTRLSANEFIPIGIFSEIDSTGHIQYWGRTSKKLKESSLILIGPEGILGRAEHKTEHFYHIVPITHKDIQIPALLNDKANILILKGNGSVLTGIDRTRKVEKGAVLKTIGSDIHYPAYYPIAEVTAVYSQGEGTAFEATPIQLLHQVSFGILYQSDINHWGNKF